MKGSGQRGVGQSVESWSCLCVMCEVCDGQSLAPRGRWRVDSRRYPDDSLWCSVSAWCMALAERSGTPVVLLSLALGKVEKSPCDPRSQE